MNMGNLCGPFKNFGFATANFPPLNPHYYICLATRGEKRTELLLSFAYLGRVRMKNEISNRKNSNTNLASYIRSCITNR